MKKLLKIFLAFLAMFVIIGCGGGGGNDTPNNQKYYRGSASPGDFAIIKRDGNTLTYTINGNALGNISETVTLQNALGNIFFDAYKNEEKIGGFLISNNLIIGELEINNNNHTIVGLETTQTNLTPQDIAGDDNVTYLYGEVIIDNNGNITDLDECEIVVKKDNTYTGLCLTNPNEIEDGLWKISNDKKYILVKANATSVNDITEESADAKVVIRPSNNGRKGLLVDLKYSDNKGGFGIGLEQKEINAQEIVGNYKVLSYSDDELWDVNVTQINNEIIYNGVKASDDSNEQISGKLLLNKACKSSTNIEDFIGSICIEDEDGEYTHNGFIDNVTGYLMFFPINKDEEDILIGSKAQ
jgi:hypothetical protein